MICGQFGSLSGRLQRPQEPLALISGVDGPGQQEEGGGSHVGRSRFIHESRQGSLDPLEFPFEEICMEAEEDIQILARRGR